MTFTAPSISSELMFPTPDTPDLGCLIQQVHPFEKDFDFHMWSEESPVLQGDHQVYFRVKCGEAGFYQRCAVYMSDGFVPPGTPITATLAGSMLGGEFRPRPSDWRKFPAQQVARQYWFHGEYRNPAAPGWHRDEMVGHSLDLYENGTLSTVGWDDTGTDEDLNDHVVEVASVNRTGYFWWLDPAVIDEAEVEAFAQTTHALYQDRHRHRGSAG
jgi:hypothetical protein